MKPHLDQPAPPELRIALEALIDQVGEVPAREKLRISREALTRVLSGRPVRRGTIAACQMALGADGGHP
jgi:hypothetical protein